MYCKAHLVLSSHKIVGFVQIHNDEIVFSNDLDFNEKLLVIVVNNLKIEFGGANQTLLFLIDESEVQNIKKIYIDSDEPNFKAFIEKLIQCEIHPSIRLKLMYGRKFHRNQKIKWTVSILLITGVIFSFFKWTVPFLVKKVPLRVEKKITDQVLHAKMFQFSKKSPEQIQLTNELHELIRNIKLKNFDFSLITLNINSEMTPNAFASLGGNIVIHKGLLPILTETEELIAIIAHEMGHVYQRHVFNSLINSVGLFSLISLIFGDVTGIAGVLINGSGSLISLKYSRELENEADFFACQILLDNNIDPDFLSKSLIKLEKEAEKQLNNNIPNQVLETMKEYDFLSTHPDTQKRVENINHCKMKTPNLKYFKIDFEFEKFKNKVKEAY